MHMDKELLELMSLTMGIRDLQLIIANCTKVQKLTIKNRLLKNQ